MEITNRIITVKEGLTSSRTIYCYLLMAKLASDENLIF